MRLIKNLSSFLWVWWFIVALVLTLPFYLNLSLGQISQKTPFISNDRNLEMKRLNEEKKRILDLIERSKKDEWGLIETLKVIDESVRTKKKRLEDLLKGIRNLGSDIGETREKIKIYQKNISENEKTVQGSMLTLIYMNKIRHLTLFPGLASFKYFLRNKRLLEKEVEINANRIDKLVRTILNLEKEEARLEYQKQYMQRLKQEEEIYSESLIFEQRQQLVYLTHIRKDRGLRLKYLSEIQAELEKMNDLIYSLEKKKRNINQPVSLAGFRNMRKKLPKPIQGKLIYRFGEKGSIYHRLYNKGVLVEVAGGEKVVSVLDGKVVYSGPFRGFGNLLIIDHGKGSLSVYGNLDKIYVKEEDHVRQKDYVGTVVFDENSKSHRFYFETRYNNIAVDPLQWLKKPHWQ
ncbi:MAG: peptidoglycan DD-metalloendopeptidase family protein [Deltaproteobacteria bacterium]|nr:peptidoglycan DD-metalloendopeptidase family protein [Deltaproteobacteria bacterium]